MSVDIFNAPNSVPQDQSIVEMTETEYQNLSRLIHSVSGISLKESKKALLSSRLVGILAQSKRENFTEYYNSLIRDKRGAGVAALIDRITTNHTFFMRESAHFDYFRTTVLPYLETSVADRDLRVWCAACSTGEEAYTLAMILDQYFEARRLPWDRRVLATDLSEKVLCDASRGVYTQERIDPLPAAWRQRYFTRLPSGECEISSQIKKEVIFRRFNLIDPVYPFRKKFHCIFCRNVMIYFDAETRNNTINKLYEMTEPGGFLFVGHSEMIDRSSSKYEYVMPAVYRRI
jgi:chemotaxis protein methyltransferase CheR